MMCPIGMIFKTGSNAAKKQSMNTLYIRSLYKTCKDTVVVIILKIIKPTATSRVILVIKEAPKIDRTGAIV